MKTIITRYLENGNDLIFNRNTQNRIAFRMEIHYRDCAIDL